MSWGVVKSMRSTYHLVLAASPIVDLRHALMNISNEDVGVQIQFGLEKEKSAATKRRQTEHTLKTWRSLFRSDIHAEITSLSSLEWRNREIPPHPLRFKIFP